MFCQNCGSQLANNARFCPRCGAAAQAPVQQAPGAYSTPASPGKQPGYMPISQRGYYIPAPAQTAKKKSKPVYRRVWFWIVIALVLLLGRGRLSDLREDGESAAAPTTPPAAGSETAQADIPDVEYGYYGSRLGDEEKKYYAQLVKEIGELHTTITFQNTGNDKPVSAFHAAVLDHPEFFWITGAHWNKKTHEDNEGRKAYDYTFTLNMTLTPDEIRREQPIIQALISELAEASSGLSEYETALYFHDYIIENTVFDNEEANAEEKDSFSSSRSAYGCIVKHKAVCSGYARAFAWLMKERGIECISVIGYASKEAAGMHEWNCARLDGDWYYIDVTWDDFQTNDGEEMKTGVKYDCFCVTTSELEETYIIGAEEWMMPDPPVCTATKYDYFRVNGLYLASCDYEQIRACLQSQLGNGRNWFYLKFSSAEDCRRAEEELFENNGFWDITGLTGYYTCYTSNNGRILSIAFEPG